MGALLPSLAPRRGPETELHALIGLLACATALLTLGAVLAVGVMGFVLPLGIAGLCACIRWPALPVGALVVLAVAVDNVVGSSRGPFSETLYSAAAGVSPIEALLYLSVACVTLDCVRRRRVPPVPWEIGGALLVLAVAFVIGTVVGYSGGAGVRTQIDGWRNVLPMIVVVPLVAAVLPPRRVPAVLWVGGALIAVKAMTALVLTARSGGGIEGIIFYEGTGNWLFLIYILVALASRVRGVPLPWWVWAALPVVIGAFVLGLKRSLWLGGVVGVAMVLALGLSRVGRRLALPALIVSAALIWVLVGAGVGVDLNGPVAQRVTSLDPTALATNAQDRYRLDERANVWAELTREPLTGLGQGVPWRAVNPLGLEHPDARNYVHNAVLWFWMKYSLLGALGYLALFFAATKVGLRVFRRHAVPRLSAVGLGTAAALVSLAVSEASGTWTGADFRFSLVLGCVIGVLGVTDPGRAQARLQAPAAAAGG